MKNSKKVLDETVKITRNFIKDNILEYEAPPTAQSTANFIGLETGAGLYRRLKQSNTSFTKLRDEVIVEIGEELMRSGISITDIEYRVGFSGGHSFRILYKRIKGINPQDFQRKIKEEARYAS